MSREEFIKHRWKAYEIIYWKHPRVEWAYECSVCEVDFDNEIITITPFEDGYQKEDFQVNIKHLYFKNPTPPKITELTKI